MILLNASIQAHHKQNKINRWLNKEIPTDSFILVILHETGKLIK